MKIEFTKGNWEEHFEYAYTTKFPFKPRFVQEEDCIATSANPLMEDGYDYTTIVTNEKYGAGTKIWLTCSFEKLGAPLITLTDSLRRDEKGDLIYGACVEAVLWKEGINVWDLYEEDGEVKFDRLVGLEFPAQEGRKYEIFLELQEKAIYVAVDDKRFIIKTESLPGEVNIGITGCEGICRLYDMKIERA